MGKCYRPIMYKFSNCWKRATWIAFPGSVSHIIYIQVNNKLGYFEGKYKQSSIYLLFIRKATFISSQPESSCDV